MWNPKLSNLQIARNKAALASLKRMQQQERHRKVMGAVNSALARSKTA